MVYHTVLLGLLKGAPRHTSKAAPTSGLSRPYIDERTRNWGVCCPRCNCPPLSRAQRTTKTEIRNYEYRREPILQQWPDEDDIHRIMGTGENTELKRNDPSS